ncbi:MAG: molybdopterin-dependent oxidoreductase [Firmicutes bacterium]|nr:molybdopterin-dependent oxidoreductase [Bacillota bacterium]
MAPAQTQRNAAKDDVWVPTVCYMCYNACNIRVHRVDGVVVKIEGNPESPHNGSRVCAKGHAAIMGLYNPYRVTKPLRRTNPEKGPGVDPGWVEISWEEALAAIADRLKSIRETDPRKLAVLSFDTQGFGTLGNVWTTAFGTPNVNPGSADYYCGNANHPISWSVDGTFFSEPDYHYAKYCILFGSQHGIPGFTKNPLGLAPRLADARQKGGLKLVVVDPYCNTAASKANEWVPIRPGTDAALALALANVLLNEEGIYDREFLARCTNAPYLIGDDGYYARDGEGHAQVWDQASGKAVPFHTEGARPALEGTFQVDGGRQARPAFALVKEHVQKYTPEKAEEITTVPAATIRRIAREFGRAASIGSTITLEGKVLPYRPAVADWSKGAIAHKHGMHTGWAIQLLDTIVGAVDVPGGHLGVSSKGPGWEPTEGPDGLLVPAQKIAMGGIPYPPKKPVRPNTAEVNELFPAASYAQPMLLDVLKDPEKYGLDYKVEMLINCRSNYMMTSVDPEAVAESFGKIPFIVSFALNIDETAELADIVLPDTHVLERLDALPNRIYGWILPGQGEWYWTVRQPVVDPPPGVRHWTEVMYHLAERIGMLEDLYFTFNANLKIGEPFRLKPGRVYSHEELVDAYFKSLFGSEHGVAWFKENFMLKEPRSIEEAYPRPFIKPRLPIYLEHFKRQGPQVQAVTAELGLEDWDVSDYQALPDWGPCESYSRRGEYDLIAIMAKQAFHTHSFTVDAAWLNELGDQYPDSKAVLINPATARRKGLADGDEVILRTPDGKEGRTRVRCFEGVHPEVVVIPGLHGHWARDRRKYIENPGLHFNSLLAYDLRKIDMASSAFDACVKVKVTKI